MTPLPRGPDTTVSAPSAGSRSSVVPRLAATRSAAVRRAGVEAAQHGDELGHRRIGGDRGVDSQREQVILPGRFVGIEHAEHQASPVVHCAHEAERERRPTVAHDQRVVRLVERDRGFHHDLANPRAAVVREVAVEVLDPLFGREDQRDGGFGDAHRAVAVVDRRGVGGADAVERLGLGAPRRDRAGRTRQRDVPVGDGRRDQLRLARRHRDRHREGTRGLADADAPPRASTANTGASATMIDTARSPANSTSTRSPAASRPPTARAGSIGMLMARRPCRAARGRSARRVTSSPAAIVVVAMRPERRDRSPARATVSRIVGAHRDRLGAEVGRARPSRRRGSRARRRGPACCPGARGARRTTTRPRPRRRRASRRDHGRVDPAPVDHRPSVAGATPPEVTRWSATAVLAIPGVPSGVAVRECPIYDDSGEYARFGGSGQAGQISAATRAHDRVRRTGSDRNRCG